MIYLTDLLESTSGQLLAQGRRESFTGFVHDSRAITPGSLFVAVSGSRYNGHDYVKSAVQSGAAGILIHKGFADGNIQIINEISALGATIVAVDDTRIALQAYSSFILQKWHPTVIAVTGSNGKTTAKEAIATVLSTRYKTFRSWRNYNDLLGLPLSLGYLEPDHKFAVLELACDHPGEIEALARIAHPQVGVITNITPKRLHYFGTLDILAKEILSLLDYLPASGGIAILNTDDPLITGNASKCKAQIRGFGLQSSSQPDSYLQGSAEKVDPVGLRFTVRSSPKDIFSGICETISGKHNLYNILAALSVGEWAGISIEEGLAALQHFETLPGRMRPHAGKDSLLLIDDTHNSSPASLQAALEFIGQSEVRPRIAILGDMLELGRFSKESHINTGKEAAITLDFLVTKGEQSALLAQSAIDAGMPASSVAVTYTYEDAAKAALNYMEQVGNFGIASATPNLKSWWQRYQQGIVLIKGSEETRMERVTELLLEAGSYTGNLLDRQTSSWTQITITQPDRPTWVEIDLNAIANNARQLKQIVGKDVSILASIKADAYGHGAVKVAHTLLHNGVSRLGVATLIEALPLRAEGIQAPIHIFGYLPVWQAREAVMNDLVVTVYSEELALELSRAAQDLHKPAIVHIKIDTGMGRLGIRSEEQEQILRLVSKVKNLPGIHLEGIFTHFAKADSADQTHARMQLLRFNEVLEMLSKHGHGFEFIHAANSAATLTIPESRFNMVRPGIALYGLNPSDEVTLPSIFKPAMSFKTQIAQVKDIPPGEGISYGCTYITDRWTRIAAIPVGYADGFRRAPSNWEAVLVHGKRVPIVGRVCMDQSMIDVSQIDDVRTGDEVVLIGRQGNEHLSAEEIADKLGTINYEIVSAILARVPRVS